MILLRDNFVVRIFHKTLLIPLEICAIRCIIPFSCEETERKRVVNNDTKRKYQAFLPQYVETQSTCSDGVADLPDHVLFFVCSYGRPCNGVQEFQL